MPAHQPDWTAEMVRALPDDGKRYEVLDGELFVSPSPSRVHQRAVRELLRILAEYCQTHALGEALDSPADIEFSDQRLLQPDVFVVPTISNSWRDATTLLLAAEVLSPSSARADRIEKRHIYQSEGVPEYWIVDPDGRVFERWAPDESRPEIVADTMVWRPRANIPALEVDLPKFFEVVLAGNAGH